MIRSRLRTDDDVVIDLRDPPPPSESAGVDGRYGPRGRAWVEAAEKEGDEHRRAALAAVLVLALLNIADVVVTQLLIRRGAVELNPVVSPLLSSNAAILVKLGIIGALGIDFMIRRPRQITLCLLWLVTGLYMCVVIVNGTQLVAFWDY